MAPGGGERRAAIRKCVLDDQAAAWNKGDLEGMRVTGSRRSCRSSRATTASRAGRRLCERYRARYQGEGKEMGKLRFSDLEIELLSPESALVRGRFTLETSKGKPTGLFTLILKKLPEGWHRPRPYIRVKSPATERSPACRTRSTRRRGEPAGAPNPLAAALVLPTSGCRTLPLRDTVPLAREGRTMVWYWAGLGVPVRRWPCLGLGAWGWHLWCNAPRLADGRKLLLAAARRDRPTALDDITISERRFPIRVRLLTCSGPSRASPARPRPSAHFCGAARNTVTTISTLAALLVDGYSQRCRCLPSTRTWTSAAASRWRCPEKRSAVAAA